MIALSQLTYSKNCQKTVLFLFLANCMTPIFTMQQVVPWQQAAGMGTQLASFTALSYEMKTLAKEKKFFGSTTLTRREKHKIHRWIMLGCGAYAATLMYQDTLPQETQELFYSNLRTVFKDLCAIPWFATTALHALNGAYDLLLKAHKKRISDYAITHTPELLAQTMSSELEKVTVIELAKNTRHLTRRQNDWFKIYTLSFVLFMGLAVIYAHDLSTLLTSL